MRRVTEDPLARVAAILKQTSLLSRAGKMTDRTLSKDVAVPDSKSGTSRSRNRRGTSRSPIYGTDSHSDPSNPMGTIPSLSLGVGGVNVPSAEVVSCFDLDDRSRGREVELVSSPRFIDDIEKEAEFTTKHGGNSPGGPNPSSGSSASSSSGEAGGSAGPAPHSLDVRRARFLSRVLGPSNAAKFIRGSSSSPGMGMGIGGIGDVPGMDMLGSPHDRLLGATTSTLGTTTDSQSQSQHPQTQSEMEVSASARRHAERQKQKQKRRRRRLRRRRNRVPLAGHLSRCGYASGHASGGSPTGSGSSSFLNTGRERSYYSLNKAECAPPIGHYNPKFKLVQGRKDLSLSWDGQIMRTGKDLMSRRTGSRKGRAGRGGRGWGRRRPHSSSGRPGEASVSGGPRKRNRNRGRAKRPKSALGRSTKKENDPQPSLSRTPSNESASASASASAAPGDEGPEGGAAAGAGAGAAAKRIRSRISRSQRPQSAITRRKKPVHKYTVIEPRSSDWWHEKRRKKKNQNPFLNTSRPHSAITPLLGGTDPDRPNAVFVSKTATRPPPRSLTHALEYTDGVRRSERYLMPDSRYSAPEFDKCVPRKDESYSDFDPVYCPNHDVAREDLGRGKHVFNSFCTRESQRRTFRACIEGGATGGLDGSALSEAQHRFHDVSSRGSKDRRPKCFVGIGKSLGREESRGSRSQTQRPRVGSDAPESALGGHLPEGVSSTDSRTRFYATFDRGSKRDRGMKIEHLHDLVYDVDRTTVEPRRGAAYVSFAKKVPRKPLLNQSVYNPEAPDFHDVTNRKALDRNVPSIRFGRKHMTGRDEHLSAAIMRTRKRQYDGYFEVEAALKKCVHARVKGDPQLRTRQGRDDINRALGRRDPGPDPHWTDNGYTSMRRRDFHPKRWVRNVAEPRAATGHISFSKMTNRFGSSIENAEERMLMGGYGKKSTGDRVRLFRVVNRHGPTGGEGVAVGTHNPKFGLVEKKNIVHTFPKAPK